MSFASSILFEKNVNFIKFVKLDCFHHSRSHLEQLKVGGESRFLGSQRVLIYRVFFSKANSKVPQETFMVK